MVNYYNYIFVAISTDTKPRNNVRTDSTLEELSLARVVEN